MFVVVVVVVVVAEAAEDVIETDFFVDFGEALGILVDGVELARGFLLLKGCGEEER